MIKLCSILWWYDDHSLQFLQISLCFNGTDTALIDLDDSTSLIIKFVTSEYRPHWHEEKDVPNPSPPHLHPHLHPTPTPSLTSLSVTFLCRLSWITLETAVTSRPQFEQLYRCTESGQTQCAAVTVRVYGAGAHSGDTVQFVLYSSFFDSCRPV